MIVQQPSRSESAAGRLSVVAGRGMFWVMSTSLLAKALALVNQIVLGWYLTAYDYGLFALAVGFAAVFTTVVNGGIQQILVRRGVERFDDLVASAFWFTTAFNLVLALGILGAAPLAATVYDEPSLVLMLTIMACGVAINSPGIIFNTRLQVSLRFRALGAITLVSAVAFSICVCTLAYNGFGPLTFVIGNIVLVLTQGVAGWILTRERVHRWRFDLSHWRSFWRDSVWLNLGNFANALTQYGDYFVLGFLIATSDVGLYMFAYMLAAQIGLVITIQTNRVVVPVLRRFVDDLPRLMKAVERFLPMVVTIAAVPSLALALVAAPLEFMIWQGKWAPAVPAIVVLAVVAPLRQMSIVALALLNAQGRFALRAAVLAFQGSAVVAGAALGGWLFGDRIAWIAGSVGLFQVVANQLVIHYVMPQPRAATLRLVGSCLWSYLIAAAAALLAHLLTRELWTVIPPAVSIVAALAVYGLIVVVLMRIFVASQFREVRDILPTRLAMLTNRVFRLRA
jgi:PST family polysaccharide transporter